LLLLWAWQPIDTERYFVICQTPWLVLWLRQCASIGPVALKPYGSRFPDVTVGDIIATQKAMRLGVKHLGAVIGVSFGGAQVFRWASIIPISCPDSSL